MQNLVSNVTCSGTSGTGGAGRALFASFASFSSSYLTSSPKTIFTTIEMTAQIVIRARTRLLTLAGQDFGVIYLPLKKRLP